MTILKRYAVKIVMFLSSYFPLYIMLLVLHYDRYNTLEKLKHVRVAIFISAMFACVLLSICSLVFLKISKGEKPLSIEEIERPDDTIISYMMTYIIPILTTNFLNKGEIFVNIVLFLLIGYLYIRLNLLYLNPLWSMFGYLSYRANSDVVIVTNIQYSRLKQIVKKNTNSSENNYMNLKGFYIANDIFVAHKENNTF